MPYEYRRFGETIVQREEGSTDDWEEVPADDMASAVAAVAEAEADREENIERGARGSIEITRADGSVEKYPAAEN